ncbi:hypothetical protein BLNAU_23055 [Blattamonas nauphoetae]|uniref:Uncharacterized protein n=1 Tax=Blattamonas nauphoetae TaxID=2049346 RepID=A0ABQ9WRB1_9EUKA|nr:hypothetical protein BLNAU_23055 [Blattamonas nauphoetae]
MKILEHLFVWCSPHVRITLVKTDLIPQIIVTLNPLSLSFSEALDIHTNLMSIITKSVWLATPFGLRDLGITDRNEQQSVHETVLTQVLVPSEQYIWHLGVNRFSIIDGSQSWYFLDILARLLEVCIYHQPTMEFVLHMPAFVTIPSCLTFFEYDYSIWYFLDNMNHTQQKWNKTTGEVRHMWKTVHRRLRMEGIGDVMEEKLRNDKNRNEGRRIVDKSIRWNNLQGINLPD